MRLVSYGDPGDERPGVLTDDDRIVPLRPLLAARGVPDADMNDVLARLPALRTAIDALCADARDALPLDSVRLGPPVPRPRAIVAVGANYADHIREVTDPHTDFPEVPVLFSKPTSSLTGPYDPIVRPVESERLDYECELAVVIGRGGRRIAERDAGAHIAGYMIANDVTARDVFLREVRKNPAYLQILRGKGYDTFCPTGPWLLTADVAPARFRIRTWVNGELRQDGSDGQMVFGVGALVASVSDCMTLAAGDVILTGTPAGVGIGRVPPCYLGPGDSVRMEISGLGVMVSGVQGEVVF
ncbi:fumarylacetoacetate hydrolase family protein [Streptomyces sp. NPDC091292]|uniref:fumarylacetoacetate hydrolase family protein n=1 Tax=Streptomyces sp. NPDC091292 TaxID=3365991 RepID=UPI003825FEE7